MLGGGSQLGDTAGTGWRSGAALEENEGKKWPHQNAAWERGGGLGETTAAAASAAASSLQVSATVLTLVVIAKNQKLD